MYGHEEPEEPHVACNSCVCGLLWFAFGVTPACGEVGEVEEGKQGRVRGGGHDAGERGDIVKLAHKPKSRIREGHELGLHARHNRRVERRHVGPLRLVDREVKQAGLRGRAHLATATTTAIFTAQSPHSHSTVKQAGLRGRAHLATLAIATVTAQSHHSHSTVKQAGAHLTTVGHVRGGVALKGGHVLVRLVLLGA